jgi:hypothetical protein
MQLGGRAPFARGGSQPRCSGPGAARCPPAAPCLPSPRAPRPAPRAPRPAALLEISCSFDGAWRGKPEAMKRVYYVSSYFWDRALESGIITNKSAPHWRTTPGVRPWRPRGRGRGRGPGRLNVAGCAAARRARRCTGARLQHQSTNALAAVFGGGLGVHAPPPPAPSLPPLALRSLLPGVCKARRRGVRPAAV